MRSTEAEMCLSLDHTREDQPLPTSFMVQVTVRVRARIGARARARAKKDQI